MRLFLLSVVAVLVLAGCGHHSDHAVRQIHCRDGSELLEAHTLGMWTGPVGTSDTWPQVGSSAWHDGTIPVTVLAACR